MDLTGKEFKFAVKEKARDEQYKIEKQHADFDAGDAQNGNLRVKIAASETEGLDYRSYEGELKITMDPPTDSEVDKSIDIIFKIVPSVIHD
jgi:hypothetical protein